MQLIRVHGNGTLSPAGSLGDNAGRELGGAIGMDVFEMGGDVHAIVAAYDDHGVQLVRVHGNGTMEARGSLDKSEYGGLELHRARGVAVFWLNGTAHALVASYSEYGVPLGNAVQLIRVHENGTLKPAGSLADAGAGDGLKLRDPTNIAAFELDDGAHALVVSNLDSAVQLIRVRGDGALVPAGSAAGTAERGQPGFALGGAYGIDAFALGGGTYAAVAAYNSDAVQLIRVRGDGALLHAGSAFDQRGFDGLDGATGVSVFEMRGRTYAIAPSIYDHAVQLIELSPVAVARVDSDAAEGGRPHGLGAEINITVYFDRRVLAAAPLELRLNSGGSAKYVSGNNTDELVFRYTVGPGERAADLNYAGIHALSGNGTIAHASSGIPAARTLPHTWSGASLGGLRNIEVDAAAPTVASVSASPDGVHGIGSSVEITARFDEPVMHSGGDNPPALRLNVSGEPRLAPYKRGNGTVEMVFAYAVGPGDRTDDLDYYGTGALAGRISDLQGNPANLALPRPGSPGSLSHSSDVLVDHALPRLIAAGSAYDGAPDGFNALHTSIGVDAFEVRGRTYAAVSSLGDDAVQLIRVRDDGALEPAFEARSGAGGFGSLLDPYGVKALAVNGTAHVLAALHGINAVQLIRVHDNGTLSPASPPLADPEDPGHPVKLNGPVWSDVFRMGGDAHALVTAFRDNGVQLVRVHKNGTLEARGSLSDDGPGGDRELRQAFGVAVFELNGSAHALATGHGDAGVQLIRIHENGTLEARDSLSDDGTGGVLNLDGPRGVAAFDLGNRTFALVASQGDNGVQLIRVHKNGTLEPAGPALDGAGDFGRIAGPFNVDMLALGNGTYAVVSANAENAVRLIRVRDGDGALLAAGSAASSGPGGFGGLGGAYSADAFVLAGRSYALAASAGGAGGVQMIELSPAAATRVDSDAAEGGRPHGLGAEINITVAYDSPVRVAGPLGLRLNSGGAAEYVSGNNTAELVFRYTVGPGEQAADLDHAGAGALSGNGTIEHAASGIPAGRALPQPGTGGSLGDLRDIAVDTRAPSPLSVSASADGAYGERRRITITVGFDEPVGYKGGAPVLHLNASGAPKPAQFVRGNDTDSLVFAYTVRAGDRSDDLDYYNATALSGRIADRAGISADLELPRPGSPGSLSHSSDVLVDHALPRLIAAGSAYDDSKGGGFGALRQPVGVDAFEVRGRTYAAVSAVVDNAVQLIRVRDDGAMEPAAEARHGYNGFWTLYQPFTVKAFDLNGTAHALVTSGVGGGPAACS